VVKLAWAADWVWGLPLIALTLTFHITAFLAAVINQLWGWITGAAGQPKAKRNTP
jgi:hypothetical protein